MQQSHIERIGVSEADAAIAGGVSLRLLAQRRRDGTPIFPYTQVGDRAIYSLDAIRATLAAGTQATPPAGGGSGRKRKPSAV